MISPELEEVLERLYAFEAENHPYPAGGPLQRALEQAVAEGLVQVRDGRHRLTEAGRQIGRDVLRRHRLAERLIADVLSAGMDHEEEACQFEHILRRGLDEKVCILLGHPSTCPHGRPIPPGDCCRRARRDEIPEVSPLADGRPGAGGVVAYLSTRDNRQVQKLMAMGILPGSDIHLIRRFPSYVFQVGYSQFTVDRLLAELIYVHWSAPQGGSQNPR